jgi:hypothetical protein
MSRGKRSRIWRVVWVSLGLLVALCAFGIISALLNSGVRVSPETTFITGPLREDGTVDYLAALNEMGSKGVTPENNAAVLLVRAFGLGEIPESIRERFFKMLGIAPVPQDGKYLEPLQKYLERKLPPGGEVAKGDEGPDPDEIALKQHSRAMERPWTKEELPLVAEWLAENEKQLDLVVAATKRERFYAPLVSNGDPPMVISAFLPLVQPCRGAAVGLRVRAMYRVKAGKVEEAWQDLLACHRLARLVSEGPTIVEGLVGITVDRIAVEGDAVLAHEGKLTAEQAGRFAAELRKLPPMRKLVEKLNAGERFMLLDVVNTGARRGAAEFFRAVESWGPGRGALGRAVNAAGSILIDWNEPMRMGNQWFDRIVATASKPAGKEREAAMAEFEQDLKRLLVEARSARVLFRNIVSTGSLRGGFGRQMGEVLIGLLMPAFFSALDAEDRNLACQAMTQVVFALAAYRADRGAYPADLAALVPKYLPTMPEDPFSGGPLRYKREESGFLLYSVGPNGNDDGGRTWGDETGSEPKLDHDDIAIRVPARKK